MFTVPPEVQSKRLSTCRRCEFYNLEFGTCGTPLVGRAFTKDEIVEIEKANTITKNRSKIRLCGCIMKLKTRLTFAECPVNRWGKFINLTNKQKAEIMSFVTEVRERGYLNRADVEKLYGYGEQVSGQKHEVQMCPSCVRDMIDKIYRTLKEETK